MADETSPDQPPDLDGAATPNRDRRPEPPVVIEGEVAESSESVEAPPPAEPRAVEPSPTAETEPVRETNAEPPPAAGRPILSAATGAIVGAAVAAAGLWFLGQRPAADPDLVSRLENLERNQPAPPPTAALAALDKRVGALEAASGASPDKGSEAAYGQRIAALESAALSAKAVADVNKDTLAMAQAARDDAAKALALATTAAQKGDVVAGAAAPAAQPGADIGGLEARIGKLEAGVAALDRPPVDLAPLAQRLDKLEGALAAPKTENRVAAEPAAPSRDGAGLAVVAQALSDRLRAGAPFPLEQTALEHLGADSAKLSILKPFAEKGAPTAGALAADFAKIAPAISAAAAPQGSGGFVDRLIANMGKVVKVTRVGEVAGDDPMALVSQIGAALGRGQIGPATAAWARLPEAARQASKEWGNEAQSRLAADKAAQDILDDAMTRLAAAGH
jgi:hypothetical protein